MADAVTNLKVVVGISQDTGAMQALVANLSDISTIVNSFKDISLGNVASQFQLISSAAKETAADVEEASQKTTAASEVTNAGQSKDAGTVDSSGVTDVGEAAKDSTDSVNTLEAAILALTAAIKEMGAGDEVKKLGDDAKESKESVLDLDEAFNKLKEGIEFVAGGFLALEGVKEAKEFADIAGTVEQLNIALTTVASNSDISADEIFVLRDKIESLGVTADQADKYLIKMINNGLDVKKWAVPLAEAASQLQKLGLSGKDVGQTIENVFRVAQTGQARLAVNIGLPKIDFNQVTKDSVGAAEQISARMGAIVETAKTHFTGIVEATKDSVNVQANQISVSVEKLKDSIGQLLLPAYSAINAQIIQFLNDMNELSDGEQKGSSAAKDLGESIRTIASVLREGLEFIVKYHGAIFDLLEAYVIWKTAIFAITTGTNLVQWLTQAITWTFGLAGAHIAEAAAATTAAEAETGLGVATAAASAGGVTKIGILVTAWSGLKKAILGLGTVAAATTVALIAGLTAAAAVALNFNHSADLVAHYTLDKLPGFKQSAYNQQKYGEQTDQSNVTPPRPPAPSLPTGVEGLPQSSIVSNEQVQASLKALGSAQDAYNKSLKEGTILLESYVQDSGKGAVSTDALVSSFQKISGEVKSAADLKAFVAEAQKVKTVFATTGNTKAITDINNAVNEAAANAKKAEKAKTAGAREEAQKQIDDAKKLADAKAQILIDNAKNVETATKAANDIGLDLDKERYAAGLLTITQYFAARRAIIQSNTTAELAALEAELAKEKTDLASIQKDVNLSPQAKQAAVSEAQEKINQTQQQITVTTPSTAVKDTTAVDEEEQKALVDLHKQALDLLKQGATIEEGEPAKIQAIIDKYDAFFKKSKGAEGAQTDEQADQALLDQYNLIETKEAEITKIRQQDAEKVAQIEATTAAYYGGEAGKVDEINVKYEKQLEELKGVAGAVQAIAAAKEADIFKAKIDAENKSLQDQVSLQESIQSVEKAQIDANSKAGANDLQTMEAENQLNQQKIDLLNKEIASNALLIAQEQQKEDQLKASGQAYGAVADAITALQVKANDLNAQLITAGTAFQNYGIQLEQTFTTNLATAIDGVINGTKSVQASFDALIIGLRKDILSSISKSFAQSITGFLGGGTQGGGIFGGLGNIESKITGTFSKLFPKIGSGTNGVPSGIPGLPSISQDLKKAVPLSPVATPPPSAGIDPAIQKKLQDAQVKASNDPATLGASSGNPVYEHVTDIDIGDSEGNPLYVYVVNPSVGGGDVLNAGLPLSTASGVGGIASALSGLKRVGTKPSATSTASAGGVPLEDLSGQPDYSDQEESSSIPGLNSADTGGEAPQIPVTSGIGTAANLPGSNLDTSALDSAGTELSSSAQDLTGAGSDLSGAGDTLSSAGSDLSSALGSLGGLSGGDGGGLLGDLGGDSGDLFDGFFKGGLVSGLRGFFKGGPVYAAPGGLLSGPGTGTSDSIPANLSDGEYVVNAGSTSKFLPLLHAINSGKASGFALGGLSWGGNPVPPPSFADGGLMDLSDLQSIALPPSISSSQLPDNSVSDSKASNVKTSSPQNMLVQLHPDAMNMTLRSWLESEISRQYGRR